MHAIWFCTSAHKTVMASDHSRHNISESVGQAQDGRVRVNSMCAALFIGVTASLERHMGSRERKTHRQGEVNPGSDGHLTQKVEPSCAAHHDREARP